MNFHPLCDRLAERIADVADPLAWLNKDLDIERESQALLMAWTAQSHLHLEPMPRIERAPGLWRLVVPRATGPVPLLAVRAPTRPLALLKGVQSHQLTSKAHAMMIRLLGVLLARAASYLPAVVDLAQGERTGVPPAAKVRIGNREEFLRWGNGVWLLERVVARHGFRQSVSRSAFLTSSDGVRSVAIRAVPVPPYIYDHRDGYHWVVPSARPSDPPRAVSGVRVHMSARRHDRARYELLTRELAQLQARHLEHSSRALAIATLQRAMRDRIHTPEAADVVL